MSERKQIAPCKEKEITPCSNAPSDSNKSFTLETFTSKVPFSTITFFIITSRCHNLKLITSTVTGTVWTDSDTGFRAWNVQEKISLIFSYTQELSSVCYQHNVIRILRKSSNLQSLWITSKSDTNLSYYTTKQYQHGISNTYLAISHVQ